MKKVMRSPVSTALLFVLAIVLLFAGTIGGVQAVLADISSDYLSRLSLRHIGVVLMENDTAVSERTYGESTAGGNASTGESYGWITDSQNGQLLSGILSENEKIKIGKSYPFKIQAFNSGAIPQYVRAVVYRYWVDENGQKLLDERYYPQTAPQMIITEYENIEYNSQYWYLDSASSTPERTVYYYRLPLQVGERTEPLFDGLHISSRIGNYVSVAGEGNSRHYEYFYSGKQFEVFIEMDAVQTHHAQDAWRSAWGVSGDVLNTLGIPND